MEINSLNYYRYNKEPSFGYKIQIPGIDVEECFNNAGKLILSENKAEYQRYLQAVKDFKNKKFDGTKLYNFYKNKINESGEMGEKALLQWQKFCAKLTETPTETPKKKKGLFNSISEFFMRKSASKQENDLSAIDVVVTGYRGAGKDFFGGYIPPEIDIKIGSVNSFIPLKENPELYLYKEVFLSADGIYKFMDKIDKEVENTMKHIGDFWS